MCVLLFDIFNVCSSSIKETNSLKSKVMCVLLFDIFNVWSLVQLKK